MMRKSTRILFLFSVALWLFMASLGGEETSFVEKLNVRLAQSARELAGKIPADEPRTVAAMPLLDELRGVTRLGYMVSEKLNVLLAQVGDVQVAERDQLNELLKEEKLSLLLSGELPTRGQHRIPARYLILGTVINTQKAINFTLRVSEVREGKIVDFASSDFSIPYDPWDSEVRYLLYYVIRPERKLVPPNETIYVPPLSLSLSALAQRRLPNGLTEETELRDGAVLRSYDQFQVAFSPVFDCHVYIFLFNSKDIHDKSHSRVNGVTLALRAIR